MDERTTRMNDKPATGEQEDKMPGETDFDSIPLEGEQPQLDEANFEQSLSKPVNAHGEELRYLKWREPTGADIERAGNPIIVDFFGEKPSLTFNEKKMSAMISTLCQIPPSTVRQLTAGDWNAIAWKLVRFFMPRMVG